MSENNNPDDIAPDSGVQQETVQNQPTRASSPVMRVLQKRVLAEFEQQFFLNTRYMLRKLLGTEPDIEPPPQSFLLSGLGFDVGPDINDLARALGSREGSK